MNDEKAFTIDLLVRDYECDLQGVVNNSVYLNYFEPTRHRFLKSIGIDFAKLHKEGTDPVVRRIEIDYRRSVTGGDELTSILQVEPKGRLQYVFRQKLIDQKDGEVTTVSINFVAFVSQGRPIPPPAAVSRAIETWWSV